MDINWFGASNRAFYHWLAWFRAWSKFSDLLTPGDLLIRLICIKHIKHSSSPTHLGKQFEGSLVKRGGFLPEIRDFTFPLPHSLGHPLDTEVVTFSEWLLPLSCEYSIAMKWFHDLWVLNFQKKNIGSICPSRWYQYLVWIMDYWYSEVSSYTADFEPTWVLYWPCVIDRLFAVSNARQTTVIRSAGGRLWLVVDAVVIATTHGSTAPVLTFTLTQFHVGQSRAPCSRTVTHNMIACRSL